MKTILILLILIFMLIAPLMATSPMPIADVDDLAVRFLPVHVYIDTKDSPLAAYQFELKTAANVKIVGIEGSGHSAYPNPPYYDPAALMQHRIIIAAYSIAQNLPTGKTQIATVHLQITGESAPQLSPELILAATENGSKIPATITLSQGDQK